jgi:hypothetical protein
MPSEADQSSKTFYQKNQKLLERHPSRDRGCFSTPAKSRLGLRIQTLADALGHRVFDPVDKGARLST